jgi:hypothetical protein
MHHPYRPSTSSTVSIAFKRLHLAETAGKAQRTKTRRIGDHRGLESANRLGAVAR